MTVDTTERFKSYAATGLLITTYVVPFQFYEIDVYVDGVLKSNGVHYTIVGGNGSTGSIKFTNGNVPTAGAAIAIVGSQTIEQPTEYTDFDDAPSQVYETTADQLTMALKEMDEKLNRTLRVDTFAAPVVPVDPVNSPNSVVVVDQNGQFGLAPAGGVIALSFIQNGAGTSPRGLQDKMRDIVSLKDWSVVGDGAANDTAGVTSANADTRAKFSPPGIYDTTLAATALDGPYWGFGQIRDVANNNRAPWFSAVKAPPASFGTYTSIDTAFNGDLSKVQIAMEHRITGVATLGQPVTGYRADPETSAIYLQLYNSSGWNQQTATNDGRTAASAIRIEANQSGQGDVLPLYINGVCGSTKPGATSFLACPAISMLAGALFAATSGCMLNPAETQMHDQGFDVTGVGWNMISNRTNGTGTLQNFWAGFRSQSIGSQSIDVGYGMVGLHKYGLDLSNATFSQGGIALKANQKILGNAQPDPTGIGRFPGSAGNEWIDYDTGLSGWRIVVGGAANLQVTTGGINMLQPLLVQVAGLTGRFVNTTDAVNQVAASFESDRATPTANDNIAIDLKVSNAAGTQVTAARLRGTLGTIGAGTEDGQFRVAIPIAGTLTEKLILANINLQPATNDGLALGTANTCWADLFLATGGVINWANGTATITGFASSGNITFNADAANVLAGSGFTFAIDGANRINMNATTLIPSADDGLALGNATTNRWSDLFLASGGVINWNNGDVTLTHSAAALTMTGLLVVANATAATTPAIEARNTVDSASVRSLNVRGARGTPTVNDNAYISFQLNNASVAGAEFGRMMIAGSTLTAGSETGFMIWALNISGTMTNQMVLTSTALRPNANDGIALGAATVGWSDLFLATGAVINFANGDVTVTHAANLLTFAGSTGGYAFDALLWPVTNDGAPLGSASFSWSDLFLASGAVVNFANSDVTLTHSTGTLNCTGSLGILSGTAIPAGGTAGAGYRVSSTSNFGLFFGSGAPTLSAARGSLYLRSDGNPYVNLNGTTSWMEDVPQMIVRATGVNFNSANTDTTLNIVFPSGFTRFRVNGVFISHASATITTATAGVFTAAAGGGTAIVNGGSPITVSTASENTNNNLMAFAINNQSTQSYNVAQLFFRVGTAQGSAATADVTVFFTPIP